MRGGTNVAVTIGSEVVKKRGLAPAEPRQTWEILRHGRCLSPFFHNLSGLVCASSYKRVMGKE